LDLTRESLQSRAAIVGNARRARSVDSLEAVDEKLLGRRDFSLAHITRPNGDNAGSEAVTRPLKRPALYKFSSSESASATLKL